MGHTLDPFCDLSPKPGAWAPACSERPEKGRNGEQDGPDQDKVFWVRVINHDQEEMQICISASKNVFELWSHMGLDGEFWITVLRSQIAGGLHEITFVNHPCLAYSKDLTNCS